MSDPNDVAATRIVRLEFSRRGVDTTRADIRVVHGIAYIRGVISKIRGSEVQDVHEEVEAIKKVLRQKQEIKDISMDVTILG